MLAEKTDYINLLKNLLLEELDFHNENSRYSSHTIHSFPAKFPPQLPRKFILTLTQPGEIVLDPMAGSGTTILEAMLNDRIGVGFDIDPLALKICRVKTNFLDWNIVYKWNETVLKNARLSINKEITTLKNEFESCFDEKTKEFLNYWFLPDTILELIALRREINKIYPCEIKEFFEVAFSSTIITKSGGVSLALDLGHTRPHLAKIVVNTNGEILQGTLSSNNHSSLKKIIRPAIDEFEKRILQNISNLANIHLSRPPMGISASDAQSLPLPDESVDLIITSPPYASNAIDYMRAHKFSLIWMGYPLDSLSKKRGKYIGSDSVSATSFEEFPPNTRIIIQKIMGLDKSKGLALSRYYSEMKRSLQETYRVLKPGKSAIFVVGSSIMKGEDTLTSVCLSEIGRTLGYEIPHIGIRRLDRDRRMMPAGSQVNLDSQIQQRMHEEYVIAFYKP